MAKPNGNYFLTKELHCYKFNTVPLPLFESFQCFGTPPKPLQKTLYIKIIQCPLNKNPLDKSSSKAPCQQVSFQKDLHVASHQTMKTAWRQMPSPTPGNSTAVTHSQVLVYLLFPLNELWSLTVTFALNYKILLEQDKVKKILCHKVPKTN